MKTSTKVVTVLLRVALGWLFLYSGITKVLNPEWTAQGFLEGAKTFSGFYDWFAQGGNLDLVNLLNSWGQLLIGAGLLFGAFTRLAGFAGALLMILYYFPTLEFPAVSHGFLVDEHVIYAFVLLLLATVRAGQYFGVDEALQTRFKTHWWL